MKMVRIVSLYKIPTIHDAAVRRLRFADLRNNGFQEFYDYPIAQVPK